MRPVAPRQAFRRALVWSHALVLLAVTAASTWLVVTDRLALGLLLWAVELLWMVVGGRLLYGERADAGRVRRRGGTPGRG